MSVFRFPATRFVGENSFSAQFQHIRSEVDEVWRELEVAYPDLADPVRVAEELLDVIHSCETGLRILQGKHGVDVWRLSVEVTLKNCHRGYYDAAE